MVRGGFLKNLLAEQHQRMMSIASRAELTPRQQRNTTRTSSGKRAVEREYSKLPPGVRRSARAETSRAFSPGDDAAAAQPHN